LRVPVSLAVVFLLVSRCCCCCCCSYRCFLIVGVLLSFLSQEVALPKNADGGKFNHYFSIVNMKNHLTRYSRFDNECSPKFEQNLLNKNINKTESIWQNIISRRGKFGTQWSVENGESTFIPCRSDECVPSPLSVRM